MQEVTLKNFVVNFDGLVGPTHTYAGLSVGNLASIKNKESPSNPKKAALQGLNKMRFLMDLGIPQAVLPPHQRPHLSTLRRLGFSGSDEQVVVSCFHEAPHLLIQCYSASAMWAANVATTSPSADTADGKLHLTPANLVMMFHRSLETATTEKILHTLFGDTDHFTVHTPLPSHPRFGDEGAANQMRLSGSDGQGIEIFVISPTDRSTTLYPMRQQLETAQAIIRRHQLRPERVVVLQQNPDSIDKGVFHNDVIAVGCGNFLFCHEKAYENSSAALQEIQQKYQQSCEKNLVITVVEESLISVEEAVASYLFNSQLLELPDRSLALIAPAECRQSPKILQYLQSLLHNKDHPISQLYFIDVRESMRNGGGPACLRLPITMTSTEFLALHQGVILTPKLYETLTGWVENHYRDRLSTQEFRDPQLIEESYAALDELTQILKLGSLYDFQK